MEKHELGTVLGIWAHPDDEAYLSGGLMALATDAGARVACVTATRGELGTPDPALWPPDRLAATRATELASCLEILGVREHHWLGHRDGGCAAADPAPAVERLCELLDQVRPDTVLTFGPDGITGHPDHRAVSAWATAAFAKAAPPGARLLYSAVPEAWERRWSALHERFSVYLPGYPVTVPEAALAVDLTLDGALAERKVRALLAQRTQTGGIVEAVGIKTYTEWVSGEAFVEPAAR
ncbi:PIG-L deacetylase family protein [Phytohabitans houttuyneae]|uniref:PIG-L domain-containing protein n=1 Tax=Phytohabitans houttuyneae TaxID=1076126 RepID=A0A6V8KKJ7_9ACTN|nr:PIG-L family deacetylase [Phytohabitans houttuyneae]GFJ82931.1 PIG-L domain-containing protein [Phytohabitans houttuyneae]